MVGRHFRLNAPKFALVFLDGRNVAVQIPSGVEILVIDSLLDPVVDRQQQVHVTWEGWTFKMFAVDIREGAEPILTKDQLESASPDWRTERRSTNRRTEVHP
jgi:hypothetical protein